MDLKFLKKLDKACWFFIGYMDYDPIYIYLVESGHTLVMELNCLISLIDKFDSEWGGFM